MASSTIKRQSAAVETLPTSLITAYSGYTFSDIRIKRIGDIYMISAHVSGSIGSTDTTVGSISQDIANYFNNFGGARYGVQGTSAFAASVMLLGDGRIRIMGNNKDTGNYADFTLIFIL